jgi:hypothetical protein
VKKMSKKKKVVCLAVALGLVLGLGVVLVPSMLTKLAVAIEAPPPPPPPPPPVAGFSAQPTIGEGPLTVEFSDTSIGDGDIVSWSWDFGDGQISYDQNPSHTYYTEGLYRVSLTVTTLAEGEIDHDCICVQTDTHYLDVIVDAGTAPASLSVRNLRIEPTYVNPRQPVTIYADVVNVGGGPGSQTVHLIINGYIEQSRGVGVSPGTAYPLSFTVYKVTPGTYTVTIGDATGWFYVMQPQ